MLELKTVSKRYGDGSDAVAVLEDVSLRVEAGETVAVVGPSGSGKSTLLNLIGGLDRPTGGTIVLDGEDLAGLSEEALAKVRNRKIGFVFQLHHLLPQCTVLENVLLPTLAGRCSAEERKAFSKRADVLLERVGLEDMRTRFPGQLSGGQRQRVALVRALICQPSVVLADEPTGSLDAETAEQTAEALIALNRMEGTTLIVATHAMRLAERMYKTYRLDNKQLTLDK